MDGLDNMSEQEKLKAENDFLKMKMMLENGAQFENNQELNDISASLENSFLKNVMAFEKQFEKRTTTTVFDKIGQPDQFAPAENLTDNEIAAAWVKLQKHMRKHGVELSVISPKVTVRELYRFTTEELFEYEIDDIDMPDMISGFVYDEFYPDYEMENTNAAIDDCIKLLLKKPLLEYVPQLAKNNLHLNNHSALADKQFKEIINQFKEAYDKINLTNINASSCTIEETTCTVTGSYAAIMQIDRDEIHFNNTWKVLFHYDDEDGYWYINGVFIDGIAF